MGAQLRPTAPESSRQLFGFAFDLAANCLARRVRLLFADLSSPSVPPPVLIRPYSIKVLIGFYPKSVTHARISKHFVILGNVE